MAKKALSPKLQARLERQHRDAVRRRLLAEASALALLKAPVVAATGRLLAQVLASAKGTPNEVKRVALSTLRSSGEQLRVDFRGAVVAAREKARDLARGQVENETAPIRQWAKRQLQEPPPHPSNILGAHALELDAFEAERASASMATSWASAGANQVVKWQRDGSVIVDLPAALNITPHLVKRIERHAVVQTTTAYADEHRTYWDHVFEHASNDNADAGGDSGEPNLPYGWLPGVYEFWSAVLDRKTCQFCRGLDGVMVPLGKPFPGDATCPAHLACRCAVLSTFVDDALSKKLPGMQIDYAALQADVMDYFRGTSLTSLMGVRHTADFIEATRKKTAPQALLAKVRNRPAYRKRQSQ